MFESAQGTTVAQDLERMDCERGNDLASPLSAV